MSFARSMPAIIDYTARFEGIREALFEITLREGAIGFTLPAVAAEMGIGVSTLKRTITGTAALPQVLVDYAHRLMRWQVLFSHRSLGTPDEPPWRQQLHAVLAHLPRDRESREVFQVWDVATRSYAGTLEQARASRKDKAAWLAEAVRALVSSLQEAGTREQADPLTITALVDGLRLAVIDGRCESDQAAAALTGYLESLLADRALNPP